MDTQLLKACMITDATSPDVPITETSPGFQVRGAALGLHLWPVGLSDKV